MKTKNLLRQNEQNFQNSFGLLILCLLLILSTTFGCASRPTPASVENKSYAITRLVSAKVLAAHPDWRDEFTVARDDLKILEAAEAITITELLEIVKRLPVDELQDGDVALYIETGILFFSDELSQIAIKNPEEVRAAATGMRRALDKTLEPPAARFRNPKTNSPNTSGAVTDQPEQALSCAAREVIMRKCPALFPHLSSSVSICG